jgi:hypothetical protein
MGDLETGEIWSVRVASRERVMDIECERPDNYDDERSECLRTQHGAPHVVCTARVRHFPSGRQHSDLSIRGYRTSHTRYPSHLLASHALTSLSHFGRQMPHVGSVQ